MKLQRLWWIPQSKFENQNYLNKLIRVLDHLSVTMSCENLLVMGLNHLLHPSHTKLHKVGKNHGMRAGEPTSKLQQHQESRPGANKGGQTKLHRCYSAIFLLDDYRHFGWRWTTPVQTCKQYHPKCFGSLHTHLLVMSALIHSMASTMLVE